MNIALEWWPEARRKAGPNAKQHGGEWLRRKGVHQWVADRRTVRALAVNRSG